MWSLIVAVLLFVGASSLAGTLKEKGHGASSMILSGVALIAGICAAFRLFFVLVGILGNLLGLVISIGFFALIVYGGYVLVKRMSGSAKSIFDHSKDDGE